MPGGYIIVCKGEQFRTKAARENFKSQAPEKSQCPIINTVLGRTPLLTGNGLAIASSLIDPAHGQPTTFYRSLNL
jgi:hypothetical protein